MKKTKFVNTSIATVVAATVMAWSAHATLLWDGNATNGTSVFKALNLEDANGDAEPNPTPNGSSITTGTDPTYGPVWIFDKVSADERVEAHGATGINPAIGDTYYIGWRSKLSSLVDDNANFQWKAYGSPLEQNFPIWLKMLGGKWEFSYQPPNQPGVLDEEYSTTISANVWYTHVLLIHVSDQANVGYMEYWLNGQQVTFTNGSTQLFGRTFDGTSVDPKWGVYGAVGTAFVNTVNALKIGTTYADVDPGGNNFPGTWEIQNVTSSKVLNNGGSTTNGSPISQWTEGTSDNLKFTFIPTSNGYYQINSVKSGLDVAVQNAGTTNGAPLIQWSYGSGGNDQWLPVQNSDGTWTFYNLHSGLVLNNPGSTSNGTQYSQWTWESSNNEKFNLIQE
jgi:hypothetical protein